MLHFSTKKYLTLFATKFLHEVNSPTTSLRLYTSHVKLQDGRHNFSGMRPVPEFGQVDSYK